jgi:hypothetical protein
MYCLCYVVVAMVVIKYFLWSLHLRLLSWSFMAGSHGEDQLLWVCGGVSWGVFPR